MYQRNEVVQKNERLHGQLRLLLWRMDTQIYSDLQKFSKNKNFDYRNESLLSINKLNSLPKERENLEIELSILKENTQAKRFYQRDWNEYQKRKKTFEQQAKFFIVEDRLHVYLPQQHFSIKWSTYSEYLKENKQDLFYSVIISPGLDIDSWYTSSAILPFHISEWSEVEVYESDADSPLRLLLIAAWCCLLLPATGLIIVLFAGLSLNARRVAFVSAVTHELRTPLTTFRLYTEMLTEGMVPENSKKEYYQTLLIEADRLNHLVENVLAFARIEKGHRAEQVEQKTSESALNSILPVLEQRVARENFQLQYANEVPKELIQVIPAAFERILINLVDNACKYGASLDNPLIHVRCKKSYRFIRIEVIDNGKGITKEVRNRLFKAFQKSDRDAANSAPGIGIGLALCRQLAQKMEGNLILDAEIKEGTCFALLLPITTQEGYKS
ncbi:MAG: HAMP domain-containing histidine kinase [Lentisphaeria bacterium]|nr:HAMP domain-containing histidine kinase [Lentisphaeria bacterium]